MQLSRGHGPISEGVCLCAHVSVCLCTHVSHVHMPVCLCAQVTTCLRPGAPLRALKLQVQVAHGDCT